MDMRIDVPHLLATSKKSSNRLPKNQFQGEPLGDQNRFQHHIFILLIRGRDGGKGNRLDNALDLNLRREISRLFCNMLNQVPLMKLTSKKRFSHQTWKIPSPMTTASWKILHHFTRPFVLSAVFRCTRSRTTM